MYKHCYQVTRAVFYATFHWESQNFSALRMSRSNRVSMAMETKYVRNIIGRALILKDDFGEKPTRSPDHRSTSVGAMSLHFSEVQLSFVSAAAFPLSYTGMKHIAVRICSNDLRNSGGFYLHPLIIPVKFHLFVLTIIIR